MATDDAIQEALYFLHDQLRKAEINLTHAEDKRMKNPDCCALCEEIKNIKRKISACNYLIGMVMSRV